MKLILANRVWISALGLCVVFSAVALIAQGEWVNPVTGLAAATLPATGHVRQPEHAETVKSFQPTTVASDAEKPDDLTRLRSRRLTLPLPGVGAAQLNDSYAQSRAGGMAHEALDIMAPRGTPVLAVEDGRVAKLFLSKPGGITLYQFDPDGQYVYYYAHLDRYAEHIKEGDSVRGGQVIGYVGSTGNASPDAPHLHFAVLRLGPERQWWRGTAINPFLIWRDTQP